VSEGEDSERRTVSADTDTAASDAPAPGRHHASGPATFGDRLRFVARGIGQLLITCGLIVLLFVVYEVYITNFFAHRAQAKVHNALEQEWQDGRDPLLPLPGGGFEAIPLGAGIANLYIPRLGADYAWTIVQGSAVPTDAELEKGPAHYGDTALPGQVGNFAVAGHRVGKGEPFLNLDKLRPGDAVIVETKTYWYVYRVKGDVQTGDLSVLGADGVPGRQVVPPTDGAVVLPVPNHPGAKPTEALMTMTTCEPKFVANNRMIVYAALQGQPITKSGSQMPAQITALYNEVST
jgi:sortase A